MLAYVSLPEGQRPGGLWIAPITFKSRAGNLVPRVEASAVRRLATTCLPRPRPSPPMDDGSTRRSGKAHRGEVRLKRFAITPDDSRPSLSGHPPILPPSG